MTGKPLSGEVLLLRKGIVVQKTIADPKTGYYEFPAVPDRYEVLPMVLGHNPKGWSGAIAADVKADFSLEPIVETEEERRRRQEELRLMICSTAGECIQAANRT